MSETYEPRHSGDANAPEDGTPVEYQKPISMMFSNQTYDKLKWVAQILLPALGTFVFTVGLLWGFDAEVVGKVTGTIVAVDTLLGLCLGISTKTYEKSGAAYDGTATLLNQAGEGPTALALDLNAHPDDLAGQKQVVLKVNTE